LLVYSTFFKWPSVSVPPVDESVDWTGTNCFESVEDDGTVSRGTVWVSGDGRVLDWQTRDGETGFPPADRLPGTKNSLQVAAFSSFNR